MSIERAITTPGWMSHQELAFLAFTAQKSYSIAEIGSWRGRSARAMSDNMAGVLYCIDTWADNAYGAVFPSDAPDLCQHKDWLWNEFNKNLSDRIGVNVFPFRMNSIEGAQKFAAEPKTFDLIFIDAGHNEEDVVQDIQAWRPLLRDGGVLCGHDYHEHHPGVRLAVDRLIPKFHVIDTIWVSD